MTVSFCVIAYNEEKAISSLFQDIRNQEYPHEKMEIIFVNSMSTDNTKKMMERFAEENNHFIRVLIADNPKKVQAAGWNIAINTAREDIIIRIDAHTQIPSDFVKKVVECMEEGESVVGGQRPNIAEEDTPWKHTLLLAEKSMFGSSIAPYRTGHHKTYVKSVFHGAYRREVFEKAGLFNENLGRTEDNEMHYRIRKAGYRICSNPKIISYQQTRSSWKEMIKQKYGNGLWIGLTTGICPRCFSLFHFVPLLFLVGIILCVILLIVGFPIWFKTLGIIYGSMNVLMSIATALREKWHWCYLLLPIIFLSLHLSYGIGTLIGIFKMPYWRKKLKVHINNNR